MSRKNCRYGYDEEDMYDEESGREESMEYCPSFEIEQPSTVQGHVAFVENKKVTPAKKVQTEKENEQEIEQGEEHHHSPMGGRSVSTATTTISLSAQRREDVERKRNELREVGFHVDTLNDPRLVEKLHQDIFSWAKIREDELLKISEKFQPKVEIHTEDSGLSLVAVENGRFRIRVSRAYPHEMPVVNVEKPQELVAFTKKKEGKGQNGGSASAALCEDEDDAVLLFREKEKKERYVQIRSLSMHLEAFLADVIKEFVGYEDLIYMIVEFLLRLPVPLPPMERDELRALCVRLWEEVTQFDVSYLQRTGGRLTIEAHKTVEIELREGEDRSEDDGKLKEGKGKGAGAKGKRFIKLQVAPTTTTRSRRGGGPQAAASAASAPGSATALEEKLSNAISPDENFLARLAEARQYNFEVFSWVGKPLEGKIPSALSQVRSITHLDLSYNKLSSLSVDLSSLRLRKLYLQNNEFTTFPMCILSIHAGDNLRVLNMSHNKLTTLPSTFSSLSSLEVLDLSYNRLRNLCGFHNFQRMEALDLTDNNLHRIPAEVGMLEKIWYLRLMANPMIQIPPEIYHAGIARIRTFLREMSPSSLPVPPSTFIDDLTVNMDGDGSRVPKNVALVIKGLKKINKRTGERRYASGSEDTTTDVVELPPEPFSFSTSMHLVTLLARCPFLGALALSSQPRLPTEAECFAHGLSFSNNLSTMGVGGVEQAELVRFVEVSVPSTVPPFTFPMEAMKSWERIVTLSDTSFVQEVESQLCRQAEEQIDLEEEEKEVLEQMQQQQQQQKKEEDKTKQAAQKNAADLALKKRKKEAKEQVHQNLYESVRALTEQYASSQVLSELNNIKRGVLYDRNEALSSSFGALFSAMLSEEEGSRSSSTSANEALASVDGDDGSSGTVSVAAGDHHGTISSITKTPFAKISHQNLHDGFDLHFSVGEEGALFHAHSAIVRARSDYFNAMLASGLKESHLDVIPIPTVSPLVFETFLSYLYSDLPRRMSPDNVVNMLFLASEYACERLRAMAECMVGYHVDVSNAAQVLQLAYFLDSTRLKNACMYYITAHYEEVKRTEGFGLMEDALRAELEQKVQEWKLT